METSFWHKKWKNNDIAFHSGEVNPLLVKYFDLLSPTKGSRIFLPLCGKTLDISWLLAQGYRVVGAELSKLAIDQLFAELDISPHIFQLEKVEHYNATDIDIFVGDIFTLSKQILGPIDAIYDRAALVALPHEMRSQYTAHLKDITDCAAQLLLCYEYDQTQMVGPPFSVSNNEIIQHYSSSYKMQLLLSTDVIGGLKGKCAAMENVWLLK